MSPVSERAPPMLRRQSCRARPMQALARVPGPMVCGQGVDAEPAGDRAVDAERDGCAAGGGSDAQEIEVRLQQRLRRRQHDRQFRGDAARDHALIGDGLRCDVAEHRRHHAERFGTASDAGDHGVEALLGGEGRGEGRPRARPPSGSPVRFPRPPARRRLASRTTRSRGVAHRAMRVQATVVPPNDGMNAECLPGPPATVMWMSPGSRPMVSQSPSGLCPVLS